MQMRDLMEPLLGNMCCLPTPKSPGLLEGWQCVRPTAGSFIDLFMSLESVPLLEDYAVYW